MSAVLQFLKALPKFTAVNLQKVSARNAVKLWYILVKIGGSTVVEHYSLLVEIFYFFLYLPKFTAVNFPKVNKRNAVKF